MNETERQLAAALFVLEQRGISGIDALFSIGLVVGGVRVAGVAREEAAMTMREVIGWLESLIFGMTDSYRTASLISVVGHDAARAAAALAAGGIAEYDAAYSRLANAI